MTLNQPAPNYVLIVFMYLWRWMDRRDKGTCINPSRPARYYICAVSSTIFTTSSDAFCIEGIGKNS